MFDELLMDAVDLLKTNGGQHLHNKATVQKNKIIMVAGDIVIDPGDRIRRLTSNGVVELYEVVDPGFHEAFEDIPKHYQMEVKRVVSNNAVPLNQPASGLSSGDALRNSVADELA